MSSHIQEHKLPISAFIVCMNEVSCLGNCIESLQRCSEIVIVDSGSTDGTLQLIQEYIDNGWPIKLIHNDWPGFAAQKQFALEQCTQPWCLSVDSDERLDENLQQSLGEAIRVPDQVVALKIARRPYLIGYGYTPFGVHEGRILRMIRNGKGSFDLSFKVHEGIVPDGEVREIKTGTLLHYRPLPINKQILKENKYSQLKTEQLVEKGAPSRTWKLFLNPPTYFLRLYFLNGLWKCGVPGFIHAMTGFAYSFLTESFYYQTRSLQKQDSYDDLDGRISQDQIKQFPRVEQQKSQRAA